MYISQEDKIKLQQLIYDQQNKEIEAITQDGKQIVCLILGLVKM